MNMSYCQFENTVKDLNQVLETLRNSGSISELIEDSSTYEEAAIRDLPNICKKILEEYENKQDE